MNTTIRKLGDKYNVSIFKNEILIYKGKKIFNTFILYLILHYIYITLILVVS